MGKTSKEFQCLLRFSRKMILCLSTKFGILKRWTIISKLIRLDLGFWWTSRQIYRRLKYKQKVLEEFQRLSRFSRKMILYSSTKFGILKPWTIISELITFELWFGILQNKFIRNSIIGRRFWKSFNFCLAFPKKWFCIRQQILLFGALNDLFQAHKIRFRHLTDFKTNF